MHGDLDRTARGGAEPEEPEPAAGLDAADPQGAVADDASAQQRRRGHVGDGIRQPCREARTHRRILGEATVPVPARKARLRTQVLAAFAAAPADATGPGEPRHSRAIARAPVDDVRTHRFDATDDLVARNDRHDACHKIAFGELQIRATDAARRDPQKELTRGGRRHRDVTHGEGAVRHRARPLEDEGAHGHRAHGTRRACAGARLVRRKSRARAPAQRRMR